MKCCFCGQDDTKVIDSRPSEDGASIRRRRECIACGRRFTTYESIEITPILVIKRDGRREQFDPEKLRKGIIKSCEKCPVSMAEIDLMIDRIKKKISNLLVPEVSSDTIGELVMQELKSVNEVAYVRFASVYREFKDITSFMAELEKMLKEKK
ncbi:MAG: transcriptional repressor NrdR [Clostridia bacterium]|nr:transcriptional repressor NrdR [Clostridia bacterium]MBR2160689.1 transcriptional repressor NrdR [Clostridia bacterium]MBR2323300.1 transcriptional repressor NrdR [Clostridia bacterium]MBR2397714.1 transcriptional repressor NrdR [Clostridia bacterium]MBR2495631.1 transcriptional repressor NrdR [Clostridia bacterium]